MTDQVVDPDIVEMVADNIGAEAIETWNELHRDMCELTHHPCKLCGAPMYPGLAEHEHKDDCPLEVLERAISVFTKACETAAREYKP